MDAKILAKYIANKYYISNYKLQIVLYFIQANYLMKTGKPYFEQPIEADSSGVFVREVYDMYDIYGSGLIPHNEEPLPEIKDTSIIASVVMQCQNRSLLHLRNIIFEQKPWKKANKSSEKIITNQSMIDYFNVS